MRIPRAADRRSRGRVPAVVAATLLSSLLPALPLAGSAAAADQYTKPAAASSEKPVKGSNGKVKARKGDTTVSAPAAKHTSWPGAAGASVVPAPAGQAPARAGKLPVALESAAAGDAKARSAAPASTPQEAKVEVLGQDLARKAGITGVLLTVGGTDAPTRVSVDYSGFAQAAAPASAPACTWSSSRPAC